jgi:Tol biopolymer transport system component
MAGRILAPFLCIAALLAACTTQPDASDGSPAPERSRPLTVEGRIVLAGEDGEIHLLALPSGEDVAVTSIRGDQFDPDAHGRLVVFRDSRDGVNVDDEIYLVRSNGKGIVNLTNAPDSNEWGPAWSPDGTRIAFASYVGGTTPFGDPDYDVFVMDADGSGETNLTNDPESYDMYPTWSPDGELIAFESTRATPEGFEPPSYDRERISDFDIWVMRPDGSGLRNLTANVRTLEKFPDWSEHGIVYVREGAIVVVSPDGSRELDLSEQTGMFGHFPAWVT